MMKLNAERMLEALNAFIDGIESEGGPLFLEIVADFQSTLEEDMDLVFEEYLQMGEHKEKAKAKWDLLALLSSARIMRKRLISLNAWADRNYGDKSKARKEKTQ